MQLSYYREQPLSNQKGERRGDMHAAKNSINQEYLASEL